MGFPHQIQSTTALYLAGIHAYQGGELARCDAFRTAMLKEFDYVVEPTGVDSPGAFQWEQPSRLGVKGNGIMRSRKRCAVAHHFYPQSINSYVGVVEIK